MRLRRAEKEATRGRTSSRSNSKGGRRSREHQATESGLAEQSGDAETEARGRGGWDQGPGPGAPNTTLSMSCLCCGLRVEEGA